VCAVPDKLLIPKTYILFVGTIEPRKNLELLFEAFQILSPSLRRQFPLVIAGKPGWRTGPIYAKALPLITDSTVLFTGLVSEKELVCLYKGATVFVYPSLDEGFGLPPLEAMSHGAPVIVSDAPVLVEVSGPGAFVVSRSDASGLADALNLLLTNVSRRTELAASGYSHAAKYSWERTARETIAVYRRMVSR
jgi:glycosyltransferase involved in cell wall biosynthesis